MDNLKPKQPSEGEEFVMDFLKELGIKFISEYKITDLKGDNKHYRYADFFLPRYDAYIEFYGLWNKNVKDDDYKFKKEVYRNNGRPCVYIYPENLGALHFIFDKRLQAQLIENSKHKELRRYHWFKLFKARAFNMGVILLMVAYLISMLVTYVNAPNYNYTIAVVMVVICFNVFRIVTAYRDIFIKMKFSLIKLLDR